MCDLDRHLACDMCNGRRRQGSHQHTAPTPMSDYQEFCEREIEPGNMTDTAVLNPVISTEVDGGQINFKKKN